VPQGFHDRLVPVVNRVPPCLWLTSPLATRKRHDGHDCPNPADIRGNPRRLLLQSFLGRNTTTRGRRRDLERLIFPTVTETEIEIMAGPPARLPAVSLDVFRVEDVRDDPGRLIFAIDCCSHATYLATDEQLATLKQRVVVPAKDDTRGLCRLDAPALCPDPAL